MSEPMSAALPEAGLAYADPAYAASFREFGTELELPNSAGWVLARQIPGTELRDATGCYPVFSCRKWDGLGEDLASLPEGLVSLTLLTDPFSGASESSLRVHFDVVKPYKDHLVTDLERPLDEVVSRHHRRYVRKAFKGVRVEVCDPGSALDEWCVLYGHIVEKHEVGGIRAFSRDCFRRQLALRGALMLKAVREDRTVAMNWYLTTADVAYFHLAGLTPEAYDLYASFALHYTAIELLHGRFRWLDLGAGAGVNTSPDSGLASFKRGWSTDTLPTYLCGKVVAPECYAELSRGHGDPAYFPAYRSTEFR